ncbi:NAD(P)/FAD-dependent oxidoreductase [Natrialbaceae archaeon AArc-T1-2]|uniref:NAD(P)/FAD-dependent oxidoreductase n=1 Tax=Natrialbaceae archaeon AArc-T1-2 TaxID=3053904 RepID=UPI00255AD8EA|nr:FAD-dependent oxidoreductase [Natrialbaceae archaeon AArc-T1-2]WIV67197.1 FAD-dependent oxidoreductase [Natrialbaceae archaeon AArc-T1-2]
MHVVVLGAGYAGLTLTRLLEREFPADVEITLVDQSPDHLVQHELHRVIRRPALASDITVSLTDAVDRATVRVARVEDVDTDARTVSLSSGSLTYDVGAICLGAETAFYGLEGVREHATPLKSLDDAKAIRTAALGAFSQPDPRLVVGGGGLSGVQVAGELAALAREEATDASITLLEQYDTVAPTFPANFQRAVRSALEDQGVEVKTGATVTDADASAVGLEGDDRLRYDAFVWTGGIRGPTPLSGDRPTVRGDLRLSDRTFALGDAASVVDAEGQAVPASAQTAVRQARTVAENVSRLVAYDRGGDKDDFEPRLETYTFDSPGWLVSVGDDAVAQLGPTVVTGRAATALKTTVGAGYLSSVGAIRNAVDLVGDELGRT